MQTHFLVTGFHFVFSVYPVQCYKPVGLLDINEFAEGINENFSVHKIQFCCEPKADKQGTFLNQIQTYQQ